MLIACLFGCSETMRVKGLHTQINKGWEFTPVYGTLIIGRLEVDWSRLTGLQHLLWLVIVGLEQELVSGMDLLVLVCVLFPPPETGGCLLSTSNWAMVNRLNSNGWETTTWSITIALILNGLKVRSPLNALCHNSDQRMINFKSILFQYFEILSLRYGHFFSFVFLIYLFPKNVLIIF